MMDSIYVCPITHQPITVPVVGDDGHTYEKEAIEDWLRHNQTSPVTRQYMDPKSLKRNYLVDKAIEEANARKRAKKQPIDHHDLVLALETAMRGQGQGYGYEHGDHHHRHATNLIVQGGCASTCLAIRWLLSSSRYLGTALRAILWVLDDPGKDQEMRQAYRIQLFSLDIHKDLVKILEHEKENDDTWNLSAECLASLLSVHVDHTHVALPHLLEPFLRKDTDDHVMAHATLRVLYSVAHACDTYRDFLVADDRAHHLVLRALKAFPHHESIQQLGCGCLAPLYHHALDDGSLEDAVIAAMTAFPDSPGVQWEACRTAAVLVIQGGITSATRFADTHVVHLLVHSLTFDKEPQIFLQMIAQAVHTPLLLDEIRRHQGLVPLLVKRLHASHTNADIQQDGFSVIQYLERRHAELVQHGLVPVILQALERFHDDRTIFQHAVKTLDKILCTHTDFCLLATPPLVTVLVEALDTWYRGDECLEILLRVLHHLCVVEKGRSGAFRATQALVDAQGLRALERLLSRIPFMTESLCTTACSLVARVVEDIEDTAHHEGKLSTLTLLVFSSLQNFTTSETMLKTGFRALAKMAQADETACRLLVFSNVLDLAYTTATTHDNNLNISIHAWTLIGILGHHACVIDKLVRVHPQAWDKIDNLLHQHPLHTEVQSVGWDLVARLAQRSIDTAGKACRAHSIQRAIDALGIMGNKIEVLGSVLSLLSVLLKIANADTLQHVGDSHVPRLLLDAMRNHPRDEYIQNVCCQLLDTFTASTNIIDSLTEQGICPLLANAVRILRKSNHSRMASTKALYHLALRGTDKTRDALALHDLAKYL